MIYCHHVPAPPLTQCIERFWFYDECFPPHRREHVLPDGTFELVIDLREAPRKLFDRHDLTQYESFRRGWVSGTHSGYIVIDALPNSSMIGVHFKPGGATLVLGLPANELTDRVVELEALWGRGAHELRDRLLAAPGPQAKFQLLEQCLLARWRRAARFANGHARVAWALQQFARQPDGVAVGAVADQLGISHKHLITEFRRQVGLTPKLFCRIRRFQEVLSQIHSRAAVAWADIALSCGYCDQSHFVKDFQAFAGLNPSAYVHHEVEDPHFVAVG